MINRFIRVQPSFFFFTYKPPGMTHCFSASIKKSDYNDIPIFILRFYCIWPVDTFYIIHVISLHVSLCIVKWLVRKERLELSYLSMPGPKPGAYTIPPFTLFLCYIILQWEALFQLLKQILCTLRGIRIPDLLFRRQIFFHWNMSVFIRWRLNTSSDPARRSVMKNYGVQKPTNNFEHVTGIEPAYSDFADLSLANRPDVRSFSPAPEEGLALLSSAGARKNNLYPTKE